MNRVWVTGGQFVDLGQHGPVHMHDAVAMTSCVPVQVVRLQPWQGAVTVMPIGIRDLLRQEHVGHLVEGDLARCTAIDV